MNITKYETNINKFKYLKKFKSQNINNDLNNLENNLIIIYPEITYQTILGFGGAFTEAAGYCFSKLSDSDKTNFIKDYFSNEGINYSFCRTHIGSCDFCLDTYSYSTKDSLSDFSISRDEKYIIPLILAAKNVNSKIKLVASPWSPPAFMKSNKKLKHGGKLLDNYKALWAEYLVKYFLEYKKHNINIEYMTIQNEPNASQIWESCNYTAQEEKELLSKYIAPTFSSNNINTKLLIWDHNKERILYRANSILKDSSISNLVVGLAYHYYSGDHFENIKLFKELYEDKLIIHSEGCTGHEWSYFKRKKRKLPNAEIYAHDIIGDLNSGSNAYIDWNILLDYNGGPTHVYNFCNAPIMLNKKSNSYIKMPSYYYIGHFSKFIKPGAKRIAFSKYTNNLEVTSFINPDNSIVIVILNAHNKSQKFNLCINQKIYSDTIDSHSIVSFVVE